MQELKQRLSSTVKTQTAYVSQSSSLVQSRQRWCTLLWWLDNHQHSWCRLATGLWFESTQETNLIIKPKNKMQKFISNARSVRSWLKEVSIVEHKIMLSYALQEYNDVKCQYITDIFCLLSYVDLPTSMKFRSIKEFLEVTLPEYTPRPLMSEDTQKLALTSDFQLN